jgi:hypothetical protein
LNETYFIDEVQDPVDQPGVTVGEVEHIPPRGVVNSVLVAHFLEVELDGLHTLPEIIVK